MDNGKITCFVSVGAGKSEPLPLAHPTASSIPNILWTLIKGGIPYALQPMRQFANSCEPAHEVLSTESTLTGSYFRLNPEYAPNTIADDD